MVVNLTPKHSEYLLETFIWCPILRDQQSRYQVPGTMNLIKFARKKLICIRDKFLGTRFQVVDSRYKVPGSVIQVPGFRYKVPDTKFYVPGSRYQVPSTRFQVPGYRYHVPSTMFQIPGSRYQVPGTMNLIQFARKQGDTYQGQVFRYQVSGSRVQI